MTVYIINDLITFRAGDNQLVLQGHPAITAKLTWPAARCLEILLEEHGNIVPHSELYRRVWEARGMNVPPNTLYQNISLIRRGLKSILPGGDKLLRTASRKGFYIHRDIRVTTGEVQGMKTAVIPDGKENTPLPVQNGAQAQQEQKWQRDNVFISRLGKLIVSLRSGLRF